MAEENAPDEDVEAAMLRMMQEEIGGEETPSANTEDDAMAEMAAAMAGESGDTGDVGNIDDMLEQEMLRAMQTDSGDSSDVSPFSGFSGGGQQTASGNTPQGIERLSDVDVNVTVELGGTSLDIKDIMAWTRDSILELEPMESDPVDVLVNGKLFARGEVVVVGDTFGVRIIELVDHQPNPSFEN